MCDDSQWPPEAATKARVGMDLQIDAREVAALRPDLVLASLSVPGMEQCVADVRAQGLSPLVLDPKCVDDVLGDIERVARAAGVPGRGRVVAGAMRAALARVERAVEHLDRPTVYWEWWPRPFISPGGRSWMVDIVRTSGGALLFAEEPKESLVVSQDRILEADPEAVVLCWVGAIAPKQDPGKVPARPGWGATRAVRGKRVYAVPDALFAAPGPRLAQGASLLAKVLHPQVSL